MADVATQNNQNLDLTNVLSTVSSGVNAYFGYQTAKQVANATLKAPAANLGIVVGGIVLIGILIVFVVKK